AVHAPAPLCVFTLSLHDALPIWSFLLGGFAQRVTFFYAPKILGGRDARKAVAGEGVKRLDEIIQLREVEWRRLGPDLLLSARVRSEEHTSELQSHLNLVCRLLLE